MSLCIKVQTLKEMPVPWVPTDSHIDLNNAKILIAQIKGCIDKIESSQFYNHFKAQLQTPQISEHFRMVLGAESKIKMVIYGIGKFELRENPKLQLGLALLMQRDLKWIGEIEVFDPALSMTECQVLKYLGCSVLQFNEDGKRKAFKPTMFYMPHCSVMLYNNLVQTNSKSNLLNNVVILGNSFGKYVSGQLFSPDLMRHILLLAKSTTEFRVKTDFEEYYKDSNHKGVGPHAAFHSLSWHFFAL